MPWDVGTLVAANTPPSRFVAALVSRRLPDPCVSVLLVQLFRPLPLELPNAVRQAEFALLPPDGGEGSDTG